MNKNVMIAVIAGIVVAAGAAAAFAATPAPKSEDDAQPVIARLSTPTIPAANALGSPDAPVTIVEFGDYLCTYCHRFHEKTKDQLIANYVDTGKVRFLFKDFPINDHLDGGSSLAAQASYCAADQGRFWEFHDGVYDNWGGEKAGWITKASMAEYARNAGVQDSEKFQECLDSGKYAGVVRDNYDLARGVGLNGTPAFIILKEGSKPELIPGAAPIETFQYVLDPLA
ncbi:MAG: DsbA family protein [Nitrososphaera sp.]|uniref:DsbA family protein n=1 Tax=Nitrososphaera sp. TaxID=1971748 RepID=UPI0017E199E4|nr:DsbA family protein [Nitrososphaera sp.]NWG37004.1 DsbA family protein [Nitrososphaera sp.]